MSSKVTKLYLLFCDEMPFIEGEDLLLGVEINKFTTKLDYPILRLFTEKQDAKQYMDLMFSFDDSKPKMEIVETTIDELRSMRSVLDEACISDFQKPVRIVTSYWGEFWPVNIDLDLNQGN